MHQPVLLNEVLEYLNPSPGKNFIDCTIGFGGHALSILEKNKPAGKVLGIDSENKVLEILKEKVSDQRLILAQGNFINLKEIAAENKFTLINGILLDLGISSWHFEKSGKGFSFQKNEPLIMNYSGKELTAEEIVNEWTENELMEIFREYGEERYARSIARVICQKRKIEPIKTTDQLVEIIKQAVPGKYRYRRIHFATKTFQALRIAVNDELDNLKKVLPQAIEVLETEGRLVVISFHSLEDRIVKHFFRQAAKDGFIKILTKKPIMASQEEIELNPRSRSAKLRAIEKFR
ncbi:MAG: 16S rRNA (cytosine(1402)-N(4))-methyltransferase RsmH [Candidatus Portnoybacteria bacterium]|nr:16S rRNA (cytosine(1402)-N(4))-methyltransferase RsmH [Candidatus Portnoybacteria bacterium]